MKKNKIYFASDFHLGYDGKLSSKKREEMVVDWLDDIKSDALEIYLLGDVFDYWFEYKKVVPRGFNLLLGKLRDLKKSGISIFYFTGNHDMWVFDYFEDELEIPTIRTPIVKELLGKKFFLAHGDGMGEISFLDKLMKVGFSNRVLQWLFARIHPNTGIKLMKYFSNLSRNSHSEYEMQYQVGKEHLVNYAEKYLTNNDDVDYFVFGHRHIVLNLLLSNNKTRFINLGDWISHFSYGVFDGEEFKIKYYDD